MDTLTNIVFHALKFIERTSIKLGSGPFPVGQAWKGLGCRHHNDENLCNECRLAWIDAVGYIEHFSAFERKLTIVGGWAALSTAVSTALANASFGIWNQGAAIEQLMSLFTLLSPAFAACVTAHKTLSNILILTTLCLSIFLFLGSLFLSSCVMALGPWSKRQCSPKTSRTFPISVFLQITLQTYLGYIGTTAEEVIYVIFPFGVGLATLGTLVCARKRKKPEELVLDVQKKDREEKLI